MRSGRIYATGCSYKSYFVILSEAKNPILLCDPFACRLKADSFYSVISFQCEDYSIAKIGSISKYPSGIFVLKVNWSKNP